MHTRVSIKQTVGLLLKMYFFSLIQKFRVYINSSSYAGPIFHGNYEIGYKCRRKINFHLIYFSRSYSIHAKIWRKLNPRETIIICSIVEKYERASPCTGLSDSMVYIINANTEQCHPMKSLVMTHEIDRHSGVGYLHTGHTAHRPACTTVFFT